MSRSMRLLPVRQTLVFLLSLLTSATVGRASDVCTVPGSHPSLREAVADLSCREISIAPGVYAESLVLSRTLDLVGPGTGTAVLAGRLDATGSGSEVFLRDLRIENGCASFALAGRAGARLTADNVVVVRDSALPCSSPGSLFADGFESGDTSVWSAQSPESRRTGSAASKVDAAQDASSLGAQQHPDVEQVATPFGTEGPGREKPETDIPALSPPGGGRRLG